MYTVYSKCLGVTIGVFRGKLHGMWRQCSWCSAAILCSAVLCSQVKCWIQCSAVKSWGGDIPVVNSPGWQLSHNGLLEGGVGGGHCGLHEGGGVTVGYFRGASHSGLLEVAWGVTVDHANNFQWLETVEGKKCFTHYQIWKVDMAMALSHQAL